MALEIIDTIFDAAKVFIPDVYEDDRGFLRKSIRRAAIVTSVLPTRSSKTAFRFPPGT